MIPDDDKADSNNDPYGPDSKGDENYDNKEDPESTNKVNGDIDKEYHEIDNDDNIITNLVNSTTDPLQEWAPTE